MILAAQVTAQQGLYLRPQFEKKWSTNPNQSFEIRTYEGYTIDVNPNTFFATAGAGIGMAIGFKRQNWLAELGVASEEASLGAGISGESYNPATGSSSFGSLQSFQTGADYFRLGISLAMRLCGKGDIPLSRRVRWESWAWTGIQRWSRPPAVDSYGLQGSWQSNSTDTVHWALDQSVTERVGYFATAGFMFKAYNRKGHSVVNIGIGYQASVESGPVFLARMRFVTSASDREYFGFLRTKGSGLYLSLSKDFYLNNLIHRNKVRSPARLN